MTTFAAGVKAGRGKFSGKPAKFVELMGCLVNLDQFFWFNIVTP